MASNSKTIFDSFGGKVGTVVIYKLYGKSVMRALPIARKSKVTDKEKMVRNAFKFVMSVMKKAKPAIQFGFADVAVTRSAFHEAMSVNLLAYNNATDKDSLQSWLTVSKGNRCGFAELRVCYNDGKIEVRWNNEYKNDRNLFNDNVVVVAIDLNEEKAVVSLSNSKRSENYCALQVKQSSSQKKYDVFIYALSATPSKKKDAAQTSTSQWVGLISL